MDWRPPSSAAVIAVLMLGSVLVASGCAHDARPPVGAMSSIPLAGETLAGDRVPIGGPGPVRLVELWATWCVPCGPATKRARSVLARHPRVVAYSLAIDGDRDAVARHASASPPLGDRPLLFPGGPGAAARAGMSQVPTFLAIDTRGRIVGRITGLRPDLEPALHRLLLRAGGRPPEPG